MANNQQGGENLGDYCFERHPVLHACAVCGDKNCPGEVYDCPVCGEKNICSSRVIRKQNPGDGPDFLMHQKTVNNNPMCFCGPVKRTN